MLIPTSRETLEEAAVTELQLQEVVVHSAREAAGTLAKLSRSDATDFGSKPSSKMKIAMLAKRVAAVREEMERRAKIVIND